ncbi:MAG: type 4a pilus biogenesis protein PilO [Phycisphaeraceae bacterium]
MRSGRSQRWRIDAIAAGLCLLATVVVYAGLLSPLWQQRQQRARWQRDLSALQAEATDAADTLAQMQREVREAEQQMSEIPLRLVPLANLNQRLARLTELASAYELSVSELRPGDVAQSEHYASVPIHLAGEGGFPAASRFLYDLHRTLPDVRVAQFELAGRPESDQAGQFRFALRWYAARPPGSADPAADQEQTLANGSGPWN